MSISKHDIRFNICTGFFRGESVEAGDHRWEPIMSWDVMYTYRGRPPMTMTAYDAAMAAGPIVEHRSAYASVWGDAS